MKNVNWMYKILVFIFFSNSLLADDFENIPKLTVRGYASLSKPADQVEMTLGVYTRNENSTLALNENNQTMHQLVSNLQAIGLDEQDYQTGRFTITPVYLKETKNHVQKDLTTINYYEVINTLAIKTTKISLAEKILEEAIRAGANQIQNLSFAAHDPSLYINEAITQATQNAFKTADILSKAAHLRLPRVLSISLDHSQNHAYALPVSHKLYTSSDTVPPLAAGNVDVEANVTVIFEIAPL